MFYHSVIIKLSNIDTYRVTLKSLPNINKMVEKEEGSLTATTLYLVNLIISFRDKVFQYSVLLVDDETNSTYNMLIENGIWTILDILSMSFKDIEDIEDKIDKRRIKLSLANTNILKVVKSFHMHNEQTGTTLNMDDWLNLEQKVFVNFRLSY